MNTPKERVEQELDELTERITKLTNFLFGKKVIESGITQSMIYEMRDQLRAMEEYALHLQRRLLIWDKTEEELQSGLTKLN